MGLEGIANTLMLTLFANKGRGRLIRAIKETSKSLGRFITDNFSMALGFYLLSTKMVRFIA